MAKKPTPTNDPAAIAATYLKAETGQFFSGIEARDLTVAEFEALSPGMRELCVTSGLYAVTEDGLALLQPSPVLESVKAGEPFVPQPFTLAEEPASPDQIGPLAGAPEEK